MRAGYVRGTDGVIAYAQVNPDYPKRPDPRGRADLTDPKLSAATYRSGDCS